MSFVNGLSQYIWNPHLLSLAFDLRSISIVIDLVLLAWRYCSIEFFETFIGCLGVNYNRNSEKSKNTENIFVTTFSVVRHFGVSGLKFFCGGLKSMSNILKNKTMNLYFNYVINALLSCLNGK